MPRFHKDKQIKKCSECPFFVRQTEKFYDINGNEHEFDICYCTPVKEKHGWNEVNENSKPMKWHCRLTNKISLDFVLTSGQFKDFTVRKVLEIAPRYVSKLIERGVFVIE